MTTKAAWPNTPQREGAAPLDEDAGGGLLKTQAQLTKHCYRCADRATWAIAILRRAIRFDTYLRHKPVMRAPTQAPLESEIMVRVPHRCNSWPLFRPAALRLRPAFAAAMLALLASAAAGSPALAQATGCARCTITIGPFSFPNPFAGPASPAYAPADRSRRSWDRRGSGEPRRRLASLGRGSGRAGGGERPGGQEAGYSVHVCVRTCDGSFFPLPYSGASGATLEQICQALCPNAEMALYPMPFGGTIDEAVSPAGARYTAQANALKFQQSYEQSCSCRGRGRAGRRRWRRRRREYGHRAHEVVVTEEASVQMSRPKPDPKAKLGVQKAPDPNARIRRTTRRRGPPSSPIRISTPTASTRGSRRRPRPSAARPRASRRTAPKARPTSASGRGGSSGSAIPTAESAKCAFSRRCSDKPALTRGETPPRRAGTEQQGSQRAAHRTPCPARIGASASNIARATRSLPRSVKCTMSR